ncbi:NAD(P)-binding protein [Ophiobolus disseminans]|uniref:NAD(P)-binding protein n=1 Tax=Ophiobolus disseminans TaxID=1469910 RepID=A0A6A6ZG57_9PLEO|nr:NAD(P)-binding protein [Ophiobolus disseminans]
MATDDRGLIAITGANGTIGYACVVYALQKGYRVRCIVRREDAFSAIKTGPSVQRYLNQLEHVVVPDNSAEGAYDDALAGAKYAVHIAGAWPMPHIHPDEQLYYPSIKSTKNIIQAAEKSGTVKRIVFTQAGAGLVDSEIGDTYGNQMEKILNEYVEVNQTALTYRPPLKSPHQAYCASKSQCMNYLNDLRISKKSPVSIVQVIPGTVIGPSEFIFTRLQALQQIDRQSKALLFDDMAPRYAFGFVHVQDCARVHIEALDEEKVSGEDVPPWYVAAATYEEGSNGAMIWNKASDMIENEFGNDIEDGVFKLGRSKMPINMPYRVDSRMTEKMFLGGDKMRGFEECVKEIAQWYMSLKAE